jgi:hypothetical protein
MASLDIPVISYAAVDPSIAVILPAFNVPGVPDVAKGYCYKR